MHFLHICIGAQYLLNTSENFEDLHLIDQRFSFLALNRKKKVLSILSQQRDFTFEVDYEE